MDSAIQTEFNSYLIYKATVEDCKIEIEALDDIAVSPISYTERVSSSKISDPTAQSCYIEKERQYINYERKMKYAQKHINKMENSLRLLSELEREVIVLNYMTSPVLSKNQINDRVNLSRSAVFKIRNKALRTVQICF